MEKEYTKLPNKDTCTGCGACKNICPVNVIDLVANEDGFLMPKVNDNNCINCGKCSNCCPVLNNECLNEFPNEIYAIRASNEIREKSSSGGFFSVVANSVFDQKGFVCGAAFDDNMILKHIIIKNKKDLFKLRGSKYLQSNTELIYRQVKNKLSEKKIVLFTGTPCQVAGLYNYLEGVTYPLLITMDILCHGVPSQHTFSKYLLETGQGKITKNVYFRDKNYGWSASNIKIEYTDNTIHEGSLRENDIYELGFQKNIFLQKACTDCKFCSFPRQGDISTGDFWGIDNVDSSQNDQKGTSIVFINNNKGNEILKNIFDNFKNIKKLPFSVIKKISNRFNAYYPAHADRDKFFALEKKKNLKESVLEVVNQKFDIGLVGIYTVGNFGGALTYFALYKVLEDLGYSTYLIERPRNAAHKPGLTKIYTKDPFPKYAKSPFYENKDAMKILNDKCKTFIVGSDQLFNDFLYHNFGEWITLDWVSDNKKKIAYAASFGHDTIWGSDHTRSKMSYFMKKFDYFSVRENSGTTITEKEFGIQSTWVLDPVFLCDISHYNKLIEHVDFEINTPYLGGYILDPTIEKQKIVEYLQDKYSLECSIYSEFPVFQKENSTWTLPICKGSIEERLANISKCNFFVADSFHGICLAIIFQKNFIAIRNKNRGSSRFESILKLLGLENQLVDSIDDILNRPKILKAIDYSIVNSKLNKERKRCIHWLKNALEDPSKKSYSDYDIATEKINLRMHHLERVEKENRLLRKQVNMLLNFNAIELPTIQSLRLYFDKLHEQQQNYIVFIAVKDTPGHNLSADIWIQLQQLGLRKNLQNKHWHSYIAVLNGSTLVYEEISTKEEEVSYTNKTGSLEIDIVSKSFRAGNTSQIKINDTDYTINRRGLNIVVYDKLHQTVIDSVCFDTHVASLQCFR